MTRPMSPQCLAQFLKLTIQVSTSDWICIHPHQGDPLIAVAISSQVYAIGLDQRSSASCDQKYVQTKSLSFWSSDKRMRHAKHAFHFPVLAVWPPSALLCYRNKGLSSRNRRLLKEFAFVHPVILTAPWTHRFLHWTVWHMILGQFRAPFRRIRILLSHNLRWTHAGLGSFDQPITKLVQLRYSASTRTCSNLFDP
jgi:hypothetical protein